MYAIPITIIFFTMFITHFSFLTVHLQFQLLLLIISYKSKILHIIICLLFLLQMLHPHQLQLPVLILFQTEIHPQFFLFLVHLIFYSELVK